MKRALVVLIVMLGASTAAGQACSLNPQPLPPGEQADAAVPSSTGGTSGSSSGNTNSGSNGGSGSGSTGSGSSGGGGIPDAGLFADAPGAEGGPSDAADASLDGPAADGATGGPESDGGYEASDGSSLAD
jgi:hypothetical protein